MTKRLRDSDRRAVDLLLDRAAGVRDGNGGGNGYVSHVQPATGPGIEGVQRVLSVLTLMPADEPPADLMARTLDRIGASAVPAGQPVHPAAITSTRPHA